MHQAEDRAKDFGAPNFALVRHQIENGREDKVAIFVATDFFVAPIDQHLGALALAQGNQLFDAGFALGGDHRPHLHALVQAVADGARGSGIGDALEEFVAGRPNRDADAGGQTALARTTKRRIHCNPGSRLHISIRHDDDRVLRAALGLHALAIGGATAIDIARDRGAADKTHPTDAGVIEDGIDHRFVAVNDLNDTLWEAGLFDQLHEFAHAHGHFLAGFQNKAIATRYRVGQEPHRHHEREVERRNRRHHAQRLANHVLVDTARDIFVVDALHQDRRTAGDFNVFDGALDLGVALFVGLAALIGNDAGKLFAVGLQQRLEFEQGLNALTDRGAAPFLERRQGRLHRHIDFLGGGKRHLGNRLGSGWVLHRQVIVRAGLDERAVNKIG